MSSRTGVVALTCLITIAAAGQETPSRHIADFDRAGFLARPAGDAPEMTALAGPRFLDLVPDSRREICHIVLEHQARVTKGLYRLIVIDARGGEIVRCTL